MSAAFLTFLWIILYCSYGDDYKYVSVNSDCGSDCDGSESNPYPTIQEGLDNTGNSDVILKIMAGTYTGSGNKNFQLSSSYYRITTEYPSDPSQTIIDCESDGFGFELYAGSYAITGLTIQNCIASKRRNVTDKYKSQTLGGAIFIQSVGTAKNISNCTFKNNKADIGAAMYIWSASVILDNVILDSNHANNHSGGVHVESAYLRMANGSIVSNNRAGGNGGGIYLESATVELWNETKVKDNVADRHGNNIYCYNAHINVFSDSAIEGSGGISCNNDCHVYEYNDKDEYQKDACPSPSPANASDGSGGVNGYLIFCLIVFIIGCIIICAYCWKKKKGKGSQYEGLLEA